MSPWLQATENCRPLSRLIRWWGRLPQGQITSYGGQSKQARSSSVGIKGRHLSLNNYRVGASEDEKPTWWQRWEVTQHGHHPYKLTVPYKGLWGPQSQALVKDHPPHEALLRACWRILQCHHISWLSRGANKYQISVCICGTVCWRLY